MKPTQSRGRGSGSCAIGVLIKAPRIGFSKTRLCPPLQPPDCKALSRCFIQDTAENVSAIALAREDIVPVAVYTPVGSEPDVQQLLPSEFFLIPQRGESSEIAFFMPPKTYSNAGSIQCACWVPIVQRSRRPTLDRWSSY